MAANRSSSRQVTQEPDKENNVFHKRPPSGGNRRPKHSNSSSLEILDPEDSLKIVLTSESDFHKESRPSSSGKRSGNVGSVPPRPDSSLTRRTPTPTKQISLQAVKRKEDRDDPIVTDIAWKELQSHSRHKGRKEDDLAHQFKEMTVEGGVKNHADKSSIPFSYSSRHHNCSHHHDDIEKEKNSERLKGRSKIPKETKEGPPVMEKTPTDAGLPEAAGGKVESSTDTDSDSDEEERKAPNQLLMEFVTCLMEKDYPNAQKLCKMILLYEPNNPEALKFQPLIDEKIDLDNEPEPESDSGESEGEDGVGEEGDDSEDDDEDSDSDSSDSESDSDEDDDDNDDEGIPEERRLDSGIASAAGSD